MERLDKFVYEKFATSSRSSSQDLIKNGGVMVDGRVITKTGFMVNKQNDIKLVKNLCPYVSRAGYKLEGAIKSFGFDVKGKIALDIGSSTGGFTDFLLQNGIKKVYAVDVGSCQLDEKIKNDNRVVVMENTDIKDVSKQMVSDVNFIVCDVSFISLTKISHKISEFLKPNDCCIVLIKPQFECGKQLAKKYNGIIKDEKIHKMVIEEVKQNFLSVNLKFLKLDFSQIKGGDGNQEYVALFVKI